MQTFRFPWEELDEDKLATLVTKVAKTFEGVVATRTPDKLDPEREKYVRPDADDDDDDDDDDEEDEGPIWYFGFPTGAPTTGKKGTGAKYAWAAVHFSEAEESDDEDDEAQCGGWFEDVDPRCEDAFLDLIAELVDRLGGELDEV